jgi:hypothetical protein
MGMDTFQSTFQLSSTCCTYWEENYLYAWWHREIHSFSGTDREAWKAHNYGCWIYNSNGSSMVCFTRIYFYLWSVIAYINLYCETSPFRSDPTENDSIEGLRPNARGPGLVTFGVCMPLLTCFMSDDFYLLCSVCMIDHRQYVPSHGEYK